MRNGIWLAILKYALRDYYDSENVKTLKVDECKFVQKVREDLEIQPNSNNFVR